MRRPRSSSRSARAWPARTRHSTSCSTAARRLNPLTGCCPAPATAAVALHDRLRSMPRLHTFRALRHRNYRLFFIGQGLSLVGTWLQQVAMGWLTYRLTGSACCWASSRSAPTSASCCSAHVAGVLADRIDRRRGAARHAVADARAGGRCWRCSSAFGWIQTLASGRLALVARHVLGVRHAAASVDVRASRRRPQRSRRTRSR